MRWWRVRVERGRAEVLQWGLLQCGDAAITCVCATCVCPGSDPVAAASTTAAPPFPMCAADSALKITEKIHSPAEFQQLDDGLIDVSAGQGIACGAWCSLGAAPPPWQLQPARHITPTPPLATMQVIENFQLFGRMLNIEEEDEAALKRAQVRFCFQSTICSHKPACCFLAVVQC